jgi:integrase
MVAVKTTSRKRGRKAGGRAKGYYFRAGRGWSAFASGKSYLLTDAHGNKLTERKTPAEVLDAAYERWGLARRQEAAATPRDTITVAEVMRRYLAYAERENPRSFDMRWQYLFDFCTGFPQRFKTKPEQAKSKDRLHPGYGDRPAAEITIKDVTDWVAAHDGWVTGRTQKKVLLRAMNWAASPEQALLKANPIKGVKVGKSRSRITYFTPDQEVALLAAARKPLAIALKVCIRTGMRQGSEFAKIEAKHIEDTPHRMWVVLKDHKCARTKGGVREILIPTDLAPLFREAAKQHPTGPIFRNGFGHGWTEYSLRRGFTDLRKRLEKQGIDLDKDACFYTCRHTYAKRCLMGYWTKPVPLHSLAELMGNSVQIITEHYGQWDDSSKQHLWTFVG